TWLTQHLPAGYRVRAQERVTLAGTNGRQIAIDLVLYDQHGRPLAVLDTKYKAPDRPDMNDIYQVTFYAHQQQCPAAYLIYPQALRQPVRGRNNGVAYQNLTFGLDGDIHDNGRAFLQELLPHEQA
ncbi:MAG: restriction endonuclease, partial [Sphaerospermopsis sp. SIO1G2]|nr:restriction endonuclease [Sphaerospermopsis sp. SIO1G2]